MGKKSVRSKGYIGKQKAKSNGYTKAEIRTMVIGFAVIAIVLVCVLWLPDALEARHLLKVKDGVVQGIEDNELICNVGTSSNKKYRKLAAVEPTEGFALESVEDGLSDTNLRYFKYAADGEAAAQEYMVQSGNGDMDKLASSYLDQMGRLSEMLYQDEEVHEEVVNGNRTLSFVVEYRMEDYSEAIAEEEAAADGDVADEVQADEESEPVYDYTQAALVYIESPIEDKCVVIQAMNTAKDDSVFGDRDALRELALKAAEGVEISK